jgi:hypothetical protein
MSTKQKEVFSVFNAGADKTDNSIILDNSRQEQKCLRNYQFACSD